MATALPPLGPNWSEHMSPQGVPYYYNSATQVSTYVRAEAQAGPPPPPPMPAVMPPPIVQPVPVPIVQPIVPITTAPPPLVTAAPPPPIVAPPPAAAAPTPAANVATTPKSAATATPSTAPTKAAPVSGGLAAKMAAFNAPKPADAKPVAPLNRQPSAGGGGLAAKFQASAAANAAANTKPTTTTKPVVSGGLASKMAAINLNPAIIAAGSMKKSMAEIMFEKFDADGSGTIETNEMHLLCNKMGYLITPGEAGLVMRALDLDGSGKIDKNEFKQWWNKEDRWACIKLDANDLALRQQASEAFSSFDTEGKGVLNRADYEKFYAMLTEKKLTTKPKDAVFADLDKNNDGTISFAEYCEWLVAIGTVKVKVITQQMIDAGKNVQLRGYTGLHPAFPGQLPPPPPLGSAPPPVVAGGIALPPPPPPKK